MLLVWFKWFTRPLILTSFYIYVTEVLTSKMDELKSVNSVKIQTMETGTQQTFHFS